ncbi:hypothetical protein [Paracoccus spongiarum]|uniref:Uncharacterized protein n=1 Tax=Paracoccus spongiarum TaxID=3064387 RepID=A0ABT9J9E5_9RHOB|nr:hypothetical protein [Paracoccus sp. 2205BS29-5]MDP5306438.1 hypothetical protein [Paracoccus sp. 2205BS29-5]
MRGTIQRVMSGLSFSSGFRKPVAGDDLNRRFGTFAGQVVKGQVRQPQLRPPQRMQSQQQRHQQSATPPQRRAVARQPRPQHPR